jgi:type III restriction enzyme
MTNQLRFKFDPNLDYQLQAIQSVADVFQGLPRHDTAFALGGDIVPNLPLYQDLFDHWLFSNVRVVQGQNDPDGRLLNRDMLLHVDEGLEVDRVSNDSWRYPNFTIEMETGTGKTYVYLRTIMELRKRYGFRKFIVVVPSVAIYEGVVKHFDMVRSHFAALYGNETVNLVRYDGGRLSTLRAFATSSFVEILVITIQSFNRHTNRIYRPSEQLPGERLPYQYIQETRPILILDEPQNMESDKARAALRTLHPLFALRYSATHRSSPNHLYSLTPFEAFQRGLVKRVRVDAVTARDDFNQPFLALDTITRGRSITARVRTYVTDAGRTREAEVTLKQGDDLHAKTGRDEHQGYVVQEIHAGRNWVEFTNGIRLHLAETVGPSRPEVFRVQIERTVLHHMQRQQELADQGIKVLSLLFIDRVANYVEHDGLIRRLFEAAFEKHKGDFPFFSDLDAADVHRGYFAVYRRRDQTEFVDTDGRNQRERDMEKEAFQLIMRDKERLLSFEEKTCFIFAHSALKEGWDNPNVFQICTLNQTVSTMRKRQEIGRGLRIPVNQDGERVFDDDVNILTVVANESYQTYAETLQNEYVEDGHATPPPKPTQFGKATARRNDDFFTDDRFRDFWTKLLHRTDYRIHIDTPALIQECIDYLNNVAQFPKPVIVIETGEYVRTTFTITLEAVRGNEVKVRVRALDTRDNEWGQAPYLAKNADLAKLFDDARLRGFKIKSIHAAGDDTRVVFANDQELLMHSSIQFETQAGQTPRRQQVTPEDRTYPVFNLIDRAARETNLTRPTLNAVFKGLRQDKQQMLLRNPEGFAATLIAAVKEVLANHVVEHIQFILAEAAQAPDPADLERYFPSKKDFAQHELVPAGPNGLYDQVQTDSDVERHFVDRQLIPDEKIIGYFKFPSTFKIPFPKLIGNYNPDWGILRYDDQGAIVLELVRETKGTEELEQLQFPHEKRKVRTAQKHFRALDLDYRVITDATPQWWLPGDELPTQDEFE